MISCDSPVAPYCEKVGDCSTKNCDYTEEVCTVYAEGKAQECFADISADLKALSLSDDAKCQDCSDAYQKRLDCAALLNSCAAFDKAFWFNGDCDEETEDYVEACRGTFDDCLK